MRVTIDTEWGEVALSYGWNDLDLKRGEAQGQVNMPYDASGTATYRDHSGYQDEHNLPDVIALAQFAQQLVGLLNAATAGARAAEAERLQRESEEREAARQRALEAVAERKDRLLNEFADEKGRIRLRGMKRWRPVTVVVRELSGDRYEPFFKYHYDKHGYGEAMGQHVRCFEVKVGSRFKSVWDDGQDDLHEWDRQHNRKVAAYDGEL